MEITFNLRPEDHIEGNIDIWVDVHMITVLPPCEFVNHICQVICILYFKIVGVQLFIHTKFVNL